MIDLLLVSSVYSSRHGLGLHPFADPVAGTSDDYGFSSIIGAARYRKLHNDLQVDYPPSHYPGLRRVALGIILFSDGGLVTRTRSGHPVMIALANHAREGRNSKHGKVHAFSILPVRVPELVLICCDLVCVDAERVHVPAQYRCVLY